MEERQRAITNKKVHNEDEPKIRQHAVAERKYTRIFY